MLPRGGADEIFLDGVRYVSAGEAAREFGFVRDYIARLARHEKIRGRQVGKVWYVDYASLHDFVVEQNYKNALRFEAIAEERRQERALHGDVKKSSESESRLAKSSDSARNIVSELGDNAAPPHRIAIARLSTMRGMHTFVDALRAASERGSLPHPADIVSQAHLPAYAITPMVEFVHKLVALTVAFMLVFGTYALVDPTYARVAMESITERVHAIADTYQHATHGGLAAFSEHARTQLTFAAAHPRESLASAATFFPANVAALARLINAKIDGFLYAIAFPDALIQKHLGGSSGATVAVEIQPYASTGLATSTTSRSNQRVFASAPTTVIENPVRERVVERVIEKAVPEEIASAGGITDAYLSEKLSELDNKLSSRMYGLASANSTAIVQTYNVTAQTNAINQLDGVRISGATFAGGTITNSSVAATGLSVSGSTQLASLTTSGPSSLATTTIAGDLTVSGTIAPAVASTTDLSAISATTTNFFATNASTTNATSTNLFSVLGNFTTAIANALTAVTATITNLTATSLVATNATTTNATSTNFYSSNLGAVAASTTNFTWINATGTNSILSYATTTNLFSTTASSTNLFSTGANLGTLVLANGTSTNFFATTASSTNIFSTAFQTGNATTTGRLFTGTFGIGTSSPSVTFGLVGNQYLTGGLGVGVATTAAGVLQTTGNAWIGGNLQVVGNSVTIGASSANTLSVNSSIISDLVPDQNVVRNLGSPSFFWNNAYVGTLNANNIAAASSTISGTSNSSFTINSANATADTQDSNLIFFRGTVVPNALLSWNSSNAAKRFEFNQPLYINSGSGSTTVPTLYLKGVAGQTANILTIASSTGSTLASIGADGAASFANITLTGSTTLQNLTFVDATGTALSLTNASTSLVSVHAKAYFGSTATTTIDSAGNLSVAGTANVTGQTTLGNFTATSGTTTNATSTTLNTTWLGIGGTNYFNSLIGPGLTNTSNALAFDFTRANSWTGLQQFNANASTTQFSVYAKAYFGGTATSTFDSAGNLSVAGTSGLTGLATLSNGFLSNASSTVTSGLFSMQGGASTTLLTASTGYFTTATSTNFLSFAATSTNLFANTASSTNLFAQAATVGALTVGGTSAFAGLSTITGGFLSQASSTVVGNFTTTGNGIFGGTLNVTGLSTLGQASTTLLSSYGPAYFGATATSSFSSAGVLTLASALGISSGGTNATSFAGHQPVVANSAGTALVSTSTISVAFGGTGSTTLSGLLKGNGTAQIATALGGTDYEFPLTFNTGVIRSSNTVTLDLTRANSWTGLQQFNANASTTQLSVYNKAYFGATATSTFDSAGNLSVAGTANVTGQTTLGQASSTLLTAATGYFTTATSSSIFAAAATSTNFFANLASSTNLFAQSATVGALTISGASTYTGLSSFQNASTSLLSVFNKAYFGSTATTTIDSAGNLSVAGTANVTGQTTLGNFTATSGTTTNATSTTFNVTTLGIGGTNYYTALNGAGLTNSSGSLQIDLTRANSWTGLQQFSNASTTIFSSYGPAYFGATATSSFSSAGALTLATQLTVPNGGTGATSLTGILKGNGAAAFTAVTGTDNYLPKWSSNSLTGTSLFYDTGSETRIGTTTNYVGNASRLFVWGGSNGANIDAMGDPTVVGGDQATIELESSSYPATVDSVYLQYVNHGVGTSLGFANSHLAKLVFSNASTSLIYTATAVPLIFGTNSTERLRLTSTGNLGLGTTSPLAKFAIHANNGETNMLLFEIASSSASATTSLFKIDNKGNVTANGNLTISGTQTSLNQASTTLLSVFSKAFFGATATSTFDSAGNLSVAGTANVTGATTLANASTTQLTNSGTTWLTSLTSALLGTDSTGKVVATTTIGNSLLTNSGALTVSAGSGLSGGGSVALGGSTSLSLNLANANSWTALQQFSNASTTLFSNYGPAYFGATATSSFSSAGALTLASALAVTSGGTGVTSFTAHQPVVANSSGNGLVSTSTISAAFGGTGASTLSSGDILVGGGTGAITSTSTLAVNKGGTGAATLTLNGILFGNGTGALQATAAAANSILVTNSSNVPAFSTTLPAHTLGGTVTGNGQNITGLNIASTTLFSAFGPAYFGATATSSFSSAGVLTLASALGATSGGTGQSAVTTGDLLYGSGTNTWGKLGIGTGGFVLGSLNGIPTWVATDTLSTITGTLAASKGGTGIDTSGSSGIAVINSGTWSASSTLASYRGGTGVNNGGNTITLGGNINTASSFTTAGANALTLTTIGSTNVTLPTSGTLAALGGTNTWTALQQFNGAASSTLFSSYGPAYFGATATSSFSTVGALTLASALTVGNGGTGATSLTGLLQGNGAGALTAVTGTAGQFPYFNGTNTLLATSSLFLATSGNVGIGSTTPGALLTIQDGTSGDQLRMGQTAGGFFYKIGRNTSTGLLNFYGTQGGANGYTFGGADGTRLTIDASGNVGIGTTTPITVSGVGLTVGTAALGNSWLNLDSGTGSNSQVRFYQGGVLKTAIYTANNDGSLRLFTSSDAIIIDSSANVGIGTAPIASFKLYANGNVGAATALYDFGTSVSGNSTVCRDGTTGQHTVCSSDARLKHDIVALPDGALDKVMHLRAVNYAWNSDASSTVHAGFIAQDTMPYVPEAVGTVPISKYFTWDSNAVLSYTVKAMQELDLKVESIASSTPSAQNQSFVDAFFHNLFARVTQWLAYAENGITDLFAGNVHAKNELCVGETCVTPEQFKAMVAASQASDSGSPPPQAVPQSSTPPDNASVQQADTSQTSTSTSTSTGTTIATSTPLITDAPSIVPNDAPTIVPDQSASQAAEASAP